MRRAAAGVAAVLALAAPAVAHATSRTTPALARKGITHAVAHHWVKPADALRYRTCASRARCATSRRCRSCARDVIASQLSQITPLSDSYISPRALALFSQLETNLDYLETHRLPDRAHRRHRRRRRRLPLVPRLGLEFHPLANFGALNNARRQRATSTRRARSPTRSSRARSRAAAACSGSTSSASRGGRPPWASGMAQAVAAQALARASALLERREPRRRRRARVRLGAAVPASRCRAARGSVSTASTAQVVLNAQLQAILSLLEYAQTSDDAGAAALAQRLERHGAGALPALRHRRLVALPARRRVRDDASTRSSSPTCSRSSRARRRTRSGSTAAQRFHALLLRPAAGRRSPRRRPRSGRSRSTASSTPRRSRSRSRARVGDARRRRQGLDLPAGRAAPTR